MRVLLIDDDSRRLAAITSLLHDAASVAESITVLQSNEPDPLPEGDRIGLVDAVVIADDRHGGALEPLAKLVAHRRAAIPLVVVGRMPSPGFTDARNSRTEIETAVAFIKAGASDYLSRETLNAAKLWQSLCPMPGAQTESPSKPPSFSAARQTIESQTGILEMISSGRPSQEVLAEVARFVERMCPGLVCTMLRLEPGTSSQPARLRHAAAPSMPEWYPSVVDGIAVEEGSSCCGTAAYRGSPVAIADLRTDPRGIPFLTMMTRLGLRACWSWPILCSKQTLLGTLAAYSPEARLPTEPEMELMAAQARVASICLDYHRLQDTRRFSEERYRALAENAATGIWQLDTGGRAVYVNPALCRMLQVESVDQVIGRHFADFITARTLPTVLRHKLRRATGASSTYRAELMGIKGALRVVMISGAPLLNNGVLSGMIGTFVDVTEHERTEAALRASEYRFRFLLDHAGDAFYLYQKDQNALFFDVNRESCAMLGYSREELLTMSLRDILYDYDSALVQRTWDRLVPGEPVTVYRSHRRKDGSLIPVETRLTLVEFEETQYVMALSRDISQRQAAEMAIRASEARIRSMLDAAMNAIISFDSAGTILEWNRVAEETFHYARGESLGRRIGQVIIPTDLQADYAGRLHLWDGGDFNAGIRTEIIALRRGGERFPAEVSVARMPHEGPAEYTIYIRDLTESRRQEAELRSRRELFDSLMEHTPAAVFIKDADGRYLYANRTVEKILGHPAKPVIGRHAREWWPSDITAAMDAHDAIVLSTGKPLQVEEAIGTGEQAQVWAGSKFPLRLADGRTVIAGTAIDVTARRRAESALRESESRYRKLIETAAEGIWVLDPDNRTSFVNEKMAEMLGCDPAYMIGRSLEEFTFPEDWEASRARLRLRAQGITDRRDVRHRRMDGSELWTSLSVSGIFDENSRHAGTLGMMTDITDRRRAEEAVRESNQTLQALFAHSPMGIIALDREMIIRHANPAAARIFEVPESELPGTCVRDVIRGESETQAALWKRLLSGQVISGMEVSRTRRNGASLQLRLHAAALRDGANSVIGVVIVFADVSESEKLKAQLVQAQKMEAIGRLAGGIAHDFGNMLAVISGYAEAMLRHLPDGVPMRTYAFEIERAANRGALLIRQLLAFNRRRPESAQRVALAEVIAGVERMLSTVIAEPINVSWHTDPGLPLVAADHAQIEQVLVNLALNARDAMPTGGQLRIVATATEVTLNQIEDLPAGRYVILSVTDTGLGMDEATRSRVFEPFFTTKAATGTGLGLSIVHGIVTERGGAIRVSSAEGRGTTFEVFLPAVSEPQRVR